MKTLIIGFGAVNIALALIRIVVGLFFILARFRFFYDPSKPKGNRVFCPARIESLTRKMSYCGIKNSPYGWAVFIAVAEVAAGLALVFGLFSVIAALGMLIVLLYATKCTCKEKVAKQNPVDELDHLACYLWTAEPLYITMCIAIVLMGPGMLSLDYLFFGG